MRSRLSSIRLQETPDPAIYRDFRAWLEANVVDLSGGAAEAETAGEATEEPDADAAEEAPAEAAPATITPTEEAAAGAPPAGEETAEVAGAADQGPWTEVAEGVLMYAADPTLFAQIAYRSMPVSEFVTGSGLDAPAEDAGTPMLDLLMQLRETFAGQLAAQGLTPPEDAFAGPEATQIAGKPAARLRFTAPPQTPENGQPFPGLDMEVILVDVATGNWRQSSTPIRARRRTASMTLRDVAGGERRARDRPRARAGDRRRDATQDPAGEAGGD